MKKIVIILAALTIAANANAKIGITVGLTSTSSDFREAVKNYSTINQYHFGLSFEQPLPLGFAVQPSLLYSARGAMVTDAATGAGLNIEKTGNIELPVMVQWGISLGNIARLFAFGEPFVSYMVDTGTFDLKGEMIGMKNWDAYNRLQYGIGTGLGVELLKHFQLSARYVWNLGDALSEEGKANVSWNKIYETVTDGLKTSNNNGVKLSICYVF